MERAGKFTRGGDLPSGALATDSSVLISSYYNAADPRDEWTELLVVADNVDMRNWSLQDNNSAQTTFQPLVSFNNIPLWNNMRAGTIIMIWHRQVGTAGNNHPSDIIKTDGYIEVSANDATCFNGGAFGTAPLYAGNTLNIAAAGDLLQLLNASGTYVHALGHKTAYGTSWPTLSTPKLNHKASLVDGEAVFVCPGNKVDEYGFLAPQDGTTYTAKSSTDISFGLPNCTATSAANSDYWRLVRQPRWPNPVLTGSVNPGNTQVILNWNSSEDLFPADGLQGYMILKNSTNSFGTPADGHTYAIGDNIGGASVLAIISSSQILNYSDNTTVPCSGGYYYRVYAFRYVADPQGNDFNTARGRAYNETYYGAVQVTYPAAVAPLSASVDRNNFCEDDPGNITLSAFGGSGNILNWFTGSCGGTLIGTGGAVNNSLTIPSPAVTTTYFARWENSCGFSSCAQAMVTVVPNTPAGIAITASANPVCTGIPVTFTAYPVNTGTAPLYQWTVNGINAGANSTTFTYIPQNGDIIACTLISNAPCATGNPATSATIIMSVGSAIPVGITITVSQNPVCTGTAVTFTASPANQGTAPLYQWTVNGISAGTSSTTFTYVPLNGDNVACTLTSNASCASGNPATSPAIIMSVSSAIPVSVNIAASQNPVCPGTSVTFTATPLNPGPGPLYQWKVNGISKGTNSTSFTYVPLNLDNIACTLTSNASCASGNPATSSPIIMSVSSAIPVSVNIAASQNPVCPGTSVTFTATPFNPGPGPLYQWKVNGINAGTGGATFVYTPADNDNISCLLTSNASCAPGSPVASNTVIMTMTAGFPVSVSISTTPGTLVCKGTPVTFTASPTNGGSLPTYQWFLSGTPLAVAGPVYQYVPSNGDVVSCTLTSNLSCSINNPASSNTVLISTSSALEAMVSIAANHTMVCPGTEVIFHASPGNEGPSPVYEWFVDGSLVQQGSSPVYLTSTLLPGKPVKCQLTSSLSCVAQKTVSSLPITMLTAPYPRVVLSEKEFLCSGTVTLLDAGGNYITYTWQDGSMTRYMNIGKEGVYWVVVSDSLGCSASDSVLVKKCSGNLFVPGAFTPNGDGLNDIFRVLADPDDIAEFNMQIFTRWGEMLFESDNPATGWDGTRGGQFCPSGSYIWKIIYKGTAGGPGADRVTEKGTLELVR
ncbi:MAG: gliding motility-associated C-terminal domain-containing protein [Bacteroidota bacterium]